MNIKLSKSFNPVITSKLICGSPECSTAPTLHEMLIPAVALEEMLEVAEQKKENQPLSNYWHVTNFVYLHFPPNLN